MYFNIDFFSYAEKSAEIVPQYAERTNKAPATHALQPVGDCLGTKTQLQLLQPPCD